MRLSEYYNLPDLDPILITDAKIKHYVNLMQQKYILYFQHTIQPFKISKFIITVRTNIRLLII